MRSIPLFCVSLFKLNHMSIHSFQSRKNMSVKNQRFPNLNYKLQVLLLITGLSKVAVCKTKEEIGNSSISNKDMYVVHAMVYQVGILTNKTDGDSLNGTAGTQEALTFYHSNGSNIDLSNIPAPLMTNVTAQSLVGVAPTSSQPGDFDKSMPWTALDNISKTSSNVYGPASSAVRHNYRKSDSMVGKNKRDIPGNETVSIIKGTAKVPLEAGVKSLSIPPLLTLNNNFSGVPVPIPNTSVVHYAKINTVAKSS